MRFVPSQPDSQSPTWESAFGLFSFQIGAVLLSSLVMAVVQSEPTISIVVSGSLSVVAAFLYAHLSESQVPGALRHPCCRRILARRAAFLTAIVAVLPMLLFQIVEVRLSQLSPSDMYIAAFLVWGLFVVPWLEMWLGLSASAWLRSWRSRS